MLGRNDAYREINWEVGTDADAFCKQQPSKLKERCVRDQGVTCYPGNDHDERRLANSTPVYGADWVNDGQVAIKSHQNESVDASVGRHRPRVLINLQHAPQ